MMSSFTHPFFSVTCIITALILFVTAMYCRLRLLAVPLERDEGGFAYIAQQMLDGIPPFVSGYSMKLTGIHAMYAMSMAIFGETPSGIHLGLLLANLGNIAFLFLLARRFLPLEAAALSAGAYAMLAVSPDVLGVFAHATHFVTLFVLASIVSFFRWRDRGGKHLLLLSGICMGMAITMKQTGVLFCPLVFAMLLSALYRRTEQLWPAVKTIALWLLGVIIPYGAILVYMTAEGVLAQFWFWTTTYALEYADTPNLATILGYLWGGVTSVTKTTFPLWALAGVGLVASLKKDTFPRDRFFPALFLLLSSLAVIPGWYFYTHYFVLMLPALSLMIGVAAFAVVRHVGNNYRPAAAIIASSTLLIASAGVIYAEIPYLFTLNTKQVSRFVYGLNPFAESSMEIASYIKANSTPDDKIAILGSEPQIYFYADRQSASKHIFVYSFTDGNPFAEKLYQEMINEIQAANPKYLVISFQNTSWNDWGGNIKYYIEPLTTLIEQKYRRVGIIDLLPTANSYRWGKDAESAILLTATPILVYERNS